MMKKYFTDGLIQIAIVLSLLRTDLNLNNLHNYVNNYPEIHEIILGTSSAYTQTNIHSQGWLNDGTNGYAHPKSIDNYYTHSILGELHSLSRYRRVRQRDNDIDAWLVVGQSLPIPSETQSVGGTAQPQIPSHSSTQPPENQGQQGQAQPEGAVGPPDDNNSPDLVNLPIEFPGSELTKEDMDLIEILWRQDMDLGVGREVYDLNMRRELEKERELELLKEQEKEEQEKLLKEKAEETQQQQLQENLNFIVDGETGEVIQVPIPATGLPDSQTQPPQEGPVDGYKVLEEEQEYQQQQQQYLQQQQQQQQQQQFLQQQTQLPPQQSQQQESNTDLQDEIEAIIASAAAQQFNSTQQEQANPESHSALEQQWAEVAELLGQDELGLDAVNSGALLQNATLSEALSHTPGSFNQTVAELTSAVPGGFSMMPPSAMTNQTFEPFPAATATNETMDDPTYGSLFNLDTQHLMFANMSMSGSGQLDMDRNSTLNHTENLLQELMETSDLSQLQLTGPVDTAIMQSLQESLTGNVSSDSAVSSMSSPSHLQDINETASVFSDHMSAYGSLQGATGGSDYDSSSETNSKVSKHINYNHPSYGNDLDYHMSDSTMNQSIASNDSESHYADMTQVNHNHTYPLQPGPDPREQRRPAKASSTKTKKSPLPEYDTKIASARDARKARQLKIPFSMDNIIHSSVDDFNEMLSKHDLSETQLQLIRDIRRRGKNKVAAQNCRKRKMDVITDLEEEVMRMRQKKEDLLRERQNVQLQRSEMKHKLDAMYQEVFNSMRDEHGQPYDPTRYSLQHAEDGSVLVVPRNCTRESHKEKGSKKKKSSKKN